VLVPLISCKFELEQKSKNPGFDPNMPMMGGPPGPGGPGPGFQGGPMPPGPGM
jgi:hypothetical protein